MSLDGHVGKIIASLTLCRANTGVHGVQDLSEQEKSQKGFPFLSNGSDVYIQKGYKTCRIMMHSEDELPVTSFTHP